ncbi:MAG: hypothetical protein LBS68_02640 [Puniceicoccales bacterium]|jgi:hypothetical protein|nr:hypothetical protein [Puniceicoccales bacterium]
MEYDITAFDRAKYGAVARGQLELHAVKKIEKRKIFAVTSADLAKSMETAFFTVWKLTFWEKIRNCFLYLAGFFIRLFTSDARLNAQFIQKWLLASGPGHENVARSVDNSEIKIRSKKLLDAMAAAIGPNGCFTVTTGPEEPFVTISTEQRELIIYRLTLGTIKIKGETSSEKLAAFLNDTLRNDENFSVTGKRSDQSDQAPPAVAAVGNAGTPAINADEFIQLLESTASIIAGLSAKTKQRLSVQPVADEAFRALMKDGDVKSAVHALHSSLSKTENLAKGMESEEKFRRKFLRNVAHYAVKACARQNIAGIEWIDVIFSDFLKPTSAVKHLLFKGVFKPESKGPEEDASLDPPLTAAFDAIGKATTNVITAESVRQKIRAVKISDDSLIENEPSFESQWNKLKLGKMLLLSSSGGVASKEAAFELIKEKVADAIPDDLTEISQLNNFGLRRQRLSGNPKEDVLLARFNAIVQGTPLEGMFSVDKEATIEKVVPALQLMRRTYSNLIDMAKETARPEKFRIWVDADEIFTDDDAERLGEIWEAEKALDPMTSNSA